MKLLTVATHSERYFPVLKQSAERHGFDLHVLGWGQEWGGFLWRFNLVKEFLKSQDPDEIVVFVDAYDVVVLQDASIVEERFRRANDAKITVGWERANSSVIETLAHIIFKTCKNRRINMGTYIGYCKDVLDVLERACSLFDCNNKKDTDDQVLFGKYCKSQPDNIRVDESLDFFLVINGALEHFDMKKNEIKVVENELVYKGAYHPCFIHAIGATNIDEVIDKLGYKNHSRLTPCEVLSYDIRSVVHFARYLRYHILAIVVIAAASLANIIVAAIYFNKKR